jgi:hypothetical protein
MKRTQNAHHTLSVSLHVLEVTKQTSFFFMMSRENNRVDVLELLYYEFVSLLVNFAIENAVLKVQEN